MAPGTDLVACNFRFPYWHFLLFDTHSVDLLRRQTPRHRFRLGPLDVRCVHPALRHDALLLDLDAVASGLWGRRACQVRHGGGVGVYRAGAVAAFTASDRSALTGYADPGR